MQDTRTKNLIRYVLPTMLSNVCFLLFTIVDGIFVGHGVGTNALGAVNLVMPFVQIVDALYMLTTIGGVTIVAIQTGKGDLEGANRAFMHALTGTFAFTVILCIIGTCFTQPVLKLLGADGVYHELATEYLFWYSCFIIPAGLSITLQGMCRNDGAPILVSVASLIGTAVNIVGDWFLIFPMQMGMAGAAIATGISQTITFLIVLSHFLRKKGSLRLRRFKPEGGLFRQIFIRGLPESIAQFATPMTTLWMNRMLASMIGDIAINAYSIICYVASFSVGIFFGTSEGLQPLIGQCYGAKDEKNMKFYFHSGLLINFVGGIAVNLLLLFFGGGVCALFGTDAQTLAYTVKVMPLYAWGFIVMSFNLMISSYFYSTTRSKQADVVNLLRSFVLNTACILLLPRLLGSSGMIWFTFGIAEALVLIVAVILLRQSEKNGIVYR